MTTFNDRDGLQGLKALKMDDAQIMLTTSAIASELTSLSCSAMVFSFSNFVLDSTTAVDLQDGSARDACRLGAAIVEQLARAGLCEVYYNGTNRVTPFAHTAKKAT
jgi:hypothetical protein